MIERGDNLNDADVEAPTPHEVLEKEAVRFGYMGLFSYRETTQGAYNYALNIAESCEDKEHVITAIQVLINTYALKQAKQRRVIEELAEMALAALSYCQDGSRSDRRRMRMIEGAHSAIEAAKPYLEE